MKETNNVIISKLTKLDDYLHKLKSKMPNSYEEFKDDWELKLLVERIL